jgi:glyoxylase-like metal-dependent hydrolase (beta-lactamase superfamily II)
MIAPWSDRISLLPRWKAKLVAPDMADPGPQQAQVAERFRSLDDVIAFYGLSRWPGGAATLDLGGRVLDALSGPGHHMSAIVFYDRYTGLLFSGDSLYQGVSMSKTGRHSVPPSIGCSTSAPPDLSATSSAATSK